MGRIGHVSRRWPFSGVVGQPVLDIAGPDIGGRGLGVCPLGTATVTTVRMRLWGPESGDALGLPGGCLTRDVRWAPVRYMVQDNHVGELQVTVQTYGREESESQPQRRAPAPAVNLLSACMRACAHPTCYIGIGVVSRGAPMVGKMFRDP